MASSEDTAAGDKDPAEAAGAKSASRGSAHPSRRAGHSLQLGLDSEDIRLARSRAAADAARERRYRFWRGVCIVVFVVLAVVLWAYVNASHLGLPVERWERQAGALIESVVRGDPEAEPSHAAEADAPMVDEPAQPAASGELTRGQAEELERLLAELDFATGPIDGVIDAATRNAIREYQAIAGLAETGEPSKELLADLREVRGLMEGEDSTAD